MHSRRDDSCHARGRGDPVGIPRRAGTVQFPGFLAAACGPRRLRSRTARFLGRSRPCTTLRPASTETRACKQKRVRLGHKLLRELIGQADRPHLAGDGARVVGEAMDRGCYILVVRLEHGASGARVAGLRTEPPSKRTSP